jgi:SSS family transporter
MIHLRTILVLLFCSCVSGLAEDGLGSLLKWEQLPPLPDPIGFAAPFAGVSNGSLVVAGGANFPDGRPWSGAQKVWHDDIFVLDEPEGSWSRVGKLPRPVAYGISITLPDGVLCVGGGDANDHHADVYLVQYEDGQISITTYPSLPVPLAYATGVLVGKSVYIMGGQMKPDERPTRQLWVLDLATAEPAWKELDTLPGHPRMLAVAGTLGGKLYVFGGTDLVPDPENQGLTRRYLNDSWRYDPLHGWQPLTDLPESRVAAPSPAPSLGMGHLLVIGGDNGSMANRMAELKDQHPGFSAEVLAYHTVTETWTSAGTVPVDIGPDPANNPGAGTWAPVTVPVVEWNGKFVIPAGEIRPGVRTTRVLTAVPASERTEVGWANIITIALYLGGMLGIGFYFSRRERSTDRFFRGGQELPWWAVGLSIYSTMLSSITFMALPAKAYTSDWSYFFSNLAIITVAPLVIALYLPFYRRLNVTSAYEYLEKRFNLAVRLFGSLSFILFQIGRMAIVLYLPAIALATVSSLDVYTCILLMAVLCIIYTMLGGIEAVVWTDVVQTFVLLGGALLTFALIMLKTDGGFGGFFELGHLNGKFFEDTVWFSPNLAVASIAVIFVGSLFNNLVSYTASQDVVQRYMLTEDKNKAVRSIWTNALMALPGTVVFLALGSAFYIFYQAHPEKLSTSISNDQILPLFVVRELPMGLAGLVIAAIMAASQSTLSSSLNSVSAAWITDFHKRLRPGEADRQHLRLAQTVILITGIFSTGVACLMARMGIASLFDAFISVIGMTGGALAGLFALGIFTRRAHGKGAFLGAISSILVLVLVRTYTPVNFFLYGAIGTTTCFVTGYLFSLFLPCKERSLTGLTLYDRE